MRSSRVLPFQPEETQEVGRERRSLSTPEKETKTRGRKKRKKKQATFWKRQRRKKERGVWRRKREKKEKEKALSSSSSSFCAPGHLLLKAENARWLMCMFVKKRKKGQSLFFSLQISKCAWERETAFFSPPKEREKRERSNVKRRERKLKMSSKRRKPGAQKQEMKERERKVTATRTTWKSRESGKLTTSLSSSYSITTRGSWMTCQKQSVWLLLFSNFSFFSFELRSFFLSHHLFFFILDRREIRRRRAGGRCLLRPPPMDDGRMNFGYLPYYYYYSYSLLRVTSNTPPPPPSRWPGRKDIEDRERNVRKKSKLVEEADRDSKRKREK